MTDMPITAETRDVIAFLVDTFNSHLSGEAQAWPATTPVASIGIDSFDFVEILFKIEDKYGVDLEYNANMNFAELTTIRDLADQIVHLSGARMAA